MTGRGRVLIAVAAAGLFLIAVLSVYVWKQHAINVLLFAGLLGLLVAHLTASSRWEDTRADVDELADRQDAVEAYLTGNEPEGAGRHADGHPARYR